MVPTRIYQDISGDPVAGSIYILGVAASVLISLIISFVFGIRIIRILHESEHKSASFGSYLKRVKHTHTHKQTNTNKQTHTLTNKQLMILF